MRRRWLILAVMIAAAAVTIAYSMRNYSREAPILRAADSVEGASPGQEATLEITYIANEGVLIASGDKQVLIDGLHRQYRVHYAYLPSPEREKIETAQAPFDRVDLLLVSHMHLDHFHPESVGLHLQHNPKSVLVSSRQVVNEVEQKFKDYQAIKARVTAATPPQRERVAMKVAGIEFEILGISHGSGRHSEIQNLGHLVKLGGKKLLHVGDAIPTAENFERFNLDEEGIDIAILPMWFLIGSDGPALVREHIKPRHIIAVHISPVEAESETEQIKRNSPAAVAFTTMLEKRRY